MRQPTRTGTATRLALLVVGITGAAAAGTDRPPGADRLPADAARMYGFVTTPHRAS